MIYFIRNAANSRVKIGFSANPLNRIADLQQCTPDHLELIGTIPGEVKHERALHKRFRSYLLKREWFLPSARMLRDIDDLIDAGVAPKAAPRKEQLNVRIPVELAAILRERAAEQRQSVSFVFSKAIRDGLRCIESDAKQPA